jgi:outer membrane lipoprotein
MPRYVFVFVCFFWLIAGCAGVPPVMQEGALPRMSLTDLIANVAGYRGQTAVMGGFVLEVENQPGQTRLVALQVPIDSGQRPGSRDLSGGRLILTYDGFIDPEVYKKGRGITVRGEILGGAANDPEVFYPYLRIQVREIHLWPEEKLSDPEYDPFYPWYRHYPYGRHPYWYYPYYYYPYYRYPYWR